MKPAEGRKRVVIEEFSPGQLRPLSRAPLPRRCVAVSAAIFSDGHDHVAARLL